MNDENIPQSKDVHNRKRGVTLWLCDIALILEVATLPAYGLLMGSTYFFFIWIGFAIALILLMYIFAAPLIGVILGVVSLFSHTRTKRNIAFSVIAIALPIIVITTIIVLFSTRVLVISFM